MFCVVIRLARGAQISKHSNTSFFPDFAGKKEVRLSVNSRNRKPNYLPQRRQGAKVMNPCPSSRANARDLKKISSCGRNDISSGLGVFAPLREHIRIRESSITGKFVTRFVVEKLEHQRDPSY
jgi:hypothetical protein